MPTACPPSPPLYTNEYSHNARAHAHDTQHDHSNDRKQELKTQHVNYIESHGEIRTLLNDFMCAVLLEKPDDLFSFACDHFAAIAPEGMSPPALVRGPPALALTGFEGTPLLELLIDAYPNTFTKPLMSTTRSPEPGEEPGIAFNFTTLEAMNEDIESGRMADWSEVRRTARV